MKNKYNIGDILTNESNTVELFIVDINSDYETIYNANGIIPIITTIKYKLISDEDTLYITEEMIDELLKLKENNN